MGGYLPWRPPLESLSLPAAPEPQERSLYQRYRDFMRSDALPVLPEVGAGYTEFMRNKLPWPTVEAHPQSPVGRVQGAVADTTMSGGLQAAADTVAGGLGGINQYLTGNPVQAASLPASLPPAPGVNGGSPIQQGAKPSLPPELPPAPRGLGYPSGLSGAQRGGQFADVQGFGNGVMDAESPAPESHIRYSMGGEPMQEYNPQGAHAPQIQGAGQAFGQHYTPASGGGTVSMMSGSPENDARATAGSRMEDLEQYQQERLAADPLALQKEMTQFQASQQMRMEGQRMKQAESQRQSQEQEWGGLQQQSDAAEAQLEAAYPNKADPAYLQQRESLAQKVKSEQMNFYLRWGIKLPTGNAYAEQIAGG